MRYNGANHALCARPRTDHWMNQRMTAIGACSPPLTMVCRETQFVISPARWEIYLTANSVPGIFRIERVGAYAAVGDLRVFRNDLGNVAVFATAPADFICRCDDRGPNRCCYTLRDGFSTGMVTRNICRTQRDRRRKIKMKDKTPSRRPPKHRPQRPTTPPTITILDIGNRAAGISIGCRPASWQQTVDRMEKPIKASKL